MVLNYNFVSVDTNLIQLDTDDLATNTNTYADNDDDLIFEVNTTSVQIKGVLTRVIHTALNIFFLSFIFSM